MFELIALGAAGLTGIVSHQSTKDYVRRRLRFTNWVENGATIGLVAGAATGIVTAVALPILPLIGLGTGILVGTGAGIGVGTGIATGARHARQGYLPDPD
jgi:hypothetical protein